MPPGSNLGQKRPDAMGRPARSVSETLDDGHIGHAAAFTHGLETILASPGLQAVDQCGHQLGAGCAEGVTQGDGRRHWR